MNEMKARGVADLLIAVTDGLKGLPEAIAAAVPDTVVQTCPRHGRSDQWRSHGSIHLVRHPLDVIAWTDRKAVIPELRAIDRAQDADAGLAALEAFEAGPWGAEVPRRRARLAAQLGSRHPASHAVPEAVRRIIATTHAIEAPTSRLRRAIGARGRIPTDEAATKLPALVLNRAAADWKRPPREWVEARTQFAITFGERFRIN